MGVGEIPGGQTWLSRFATSRDGLRLHARDHAPAANGDVFTPVVCLAGLARTGADFDSLAQHLTRYAKRPRRVVAIDYRGRGLSGRDANWRNYDPRIEATDALDHLGALGIEHAIFAGTSRGGLVMTAIAVMRPSIMRAAILNDIGPVIEGRGLARIRQYVGKLPQPNDMKDAAALLKSIGDKQFPALTDTDWMTMAGRTWKQENGRLVTDYDPALMRGIGKLNLERPLPDLWRYFAGFNAIPVFSIRGQNSDLFSAATQEEMARRHPRLTTHVVPGQGHAPLLADPATHLAVDEFLAAV